MSICLNTYTSMAKYIVMNGQRIKVEICRPRKAKGASLPKRAKGFRGQIGARYLAKENGQIKCEFPKESAQP